MAATILSLLGALAMLASVVYFQGWATLGLAMLAGPLTNVVGWALLVYGPGPFRREWDSLLKLGQDIAMQGMTDK